MLFLKDSESKTQSYQITRYVLRMVKERYLYMYVLQNLQLISCPKVTCAMKRWSVQMKTMTGTQTLQTLLLCSTVVAIVQVDEARRVKKHPRELGEELV